MRKFFKLFFTSLFIILLVILAIVLFKTLTFNSKQINAVNKIHNTEISASAIDRFCSILKHPTVSYPHKIDTLAFIEQDSAIQSLYPLLHKRLERQTVNDFSLVYHWKGKDSDLDPILLLSHLDVVPIEEDAMSLWEHPPFSGKIVDGNIWGRGTLDVKISTIGILEAVTLLLEEEFQPSRDIYLAFGHDEEVGGTNGAKSICAYFEKQNIQFEYVLDEGLVVLKDALEGLEKPLAMIGIAEKGFANIKLSVKLPDGGHSSMPPSKTAIGMLSKAVNHLEQNQFPSKINGAVKALFEYAGPEMSPLYKVLFANLWLTKGIIKKQLGKDATAAALLRTTTAPTIMNSGIKSNVLPSMADAVVNFRILPGETVASVKERVIKIIDNPLVEVNLDPNFSSNPSKVSDLDSFGFRSIQKTVQEIFPEAVISPGLVIVATDSRHYQTIANDIYRFLPVEISRQDIKGIHGHNEHISIENFKNTISFYKRLIVNSGK